MEFGKVKLSRDKSRYFFSSATASSAPATMGGTNACAAMPPKAAAGAVQLHLGRHRTCVIYMCGWRRERRRHQSKQDAMGEYEWRAKVKIRSKDRNLLLFDKQNSSWKRTEPTKKERGSASVEVHEPPLVPPVSNESVKQKELENDRS